MYYEVTVTRIDYSDLTVAVEANSEEEAKDKAVDYAIEDGGWQECSTEFEADDPVKMSDEDYYKYYK